MAIRVIDQHMSGPWDPWLRQWLGPWVHPGSALESDRRELIRAPFGDVGFLLSGRGQGEVCCTGKVQGQIHKWIRYGPQESIFEWHM